MSRNQFFVLAGLLLALALGSSLGLSREPAKQPEPADSVKAIKNTIATYFENLSQGKAEANLKLFVREDVTIVGIPGEEGVEKIWQKKAAEVIKEYSGGVKHTVDSTQVDLVDDALGVARVKYHTEFVKCRAGFTLTSQGGSWRIASMVFETRFP
jgi:hypothetical protein